VVLPWTQVSSNNLGVSLSTDGMTSYSAGLNEAFTLLHNIDESKQPQMLFLSDGYPNDNLRDREEAIQRIKDWSTNRAYQLNIFTVDFDHSASGSGAAVLRDLADQLNGTSITANDGSELKERFDAIARYSSYDDILVYATKAQPSHLMCLLAPILMGFIFFLLYSVLLNLFAYPLVIVTLFGFPILIALGLNLCAHYSTLFSETQEMVIIFVSVVLLAFFVYWQMDNARMTAAALILGTNVFFEFPSLVVIQLFLLVLWGMWAKFVSSLIFGETGSVFSGFYLYFERLFLNPWEIATQGTTLPAILLSCQLVLVTGTMYAFNNLAVSRAAAALYFGFEKKFTYGGITLYYDVLTGALGTATISGVIKVFAYLIDRPLEILESNTKDRKVELSIFVILGSLGHAAYSSFMPGKSDMAYVPIQAISYVITAALVSSIWLLPYLRRSLQLLINAANFFTIIIAGVTGDSFASSIASAGDLTLNQSSAIITAAAVAKSFTTIASITLPAVILPIAYLICQELQIFRIESFTLGCVAGGALLTLAIDSQYTAVMSSIVCVLRQTSADEMYLPGSPEALRNRSKYEMQTLAMLGIKPKNSSTVTGRCNVDEKETSVTPSTPKLAAKLPARSRSRSKSARRR